MRNNRQPPFWMFLAALLILSAACSTLPTAAPATQTTAPSLQSTQSLSPADRETHTPPATSEPQSLLGVSESDLRGVILRFWHIWSGPAGEVVTAVVEDFNLHNPWGILVVAVNQGSLDEMHEQFLQVQEQGDVPDLLVGALYQAQIWDQGDHLVNINDYVDDPVWGYSAAEKADFYPVFWDYDLVQEKRLGIPAQRSGHGLFYNQTWARELGFPDAPQSSDAFVTQACAAAKASPNPGAGGWVVSTDYPSILSWIYAFGAELYRADALASDLDAYQFSQPEVEQTFSFLRELYDQSCAWLPENPWPEDYFASRSALFASGSVMDIPYFINAMRQTGNTDQWSFLAYPGPQGVTGLDVYGPSFQVVKSSPQKQLAAWLFIKWMLEPQNQARLLEATSAFPLRKSVVENLGAAAARPAQWTAAVDLLDSGRGEPRLQSWDTVRWALSDAATQLFRSYTTAEQIPNLVKFLDRTAEDLHH